MHQKGNIMKTKIFLCIHILAVVFILFGCNTTKAGEKSSLNISETEALSFTVTNVSSTDVAIEITNYSGDTLCWGSWFCIEKEENEEWYELEPIELPEGQVWIWDDILSTLPGEGPVQLTVKWDNYYGPLPGGCYRVVKKFFYNERKLDDIFYIACEFIIP